jgi:hypothetical protein
VPFQLSNIKQGASKNMEAWRYLVTEIAFGQDAESVQGELNDIGSGAWELVSFIPLNGGNSKFLAIFKHRNPRP